MQLIPPLAAYPYVQYNDDDDIVAFFKAYNAMAQEYVDFFNTYNLADYKSNLIVGDLLNWCAAGIYGMPRPFLVEGSAAEYIGSYGTGHYGLLEYGGLILTEDPPPSYSFVDDNIYKRYLTWNFFKGDGVTFSIPWLKRRVMRFLTDEPYPEEHYDVSVEFSGNNLVTIRIPEAYIHASVFRSLVRAGLLVLPFQYSFTVVLT